MIAWLREWARADGVGTVIFVYEASGQGFGLHDQLRASGIRCFVLAPTRIARSVKQSRTKTDEKDAEGLLELVRGHVLAGNALPSVWVPDRQTRDDREVARSRLDVADKLGATKTQIRTLLKRHGVEKPRELGQGWTGLYREWLTYLASRGVELGPGARVGLGTLLRQMRFLEGERGLLDQAVEGLSRTQRYAVPAEALSAQPGVGVLTAMVFLTELGDLGRFRNRRQLGSYLGLVPGCAESGEASDRKGRITRQGPRRVRKLLCQAAHAWLRSRPLEQSVYKRIIRKNPQKKKKAVVASMRRLGIRLWHIGLEAQRRAGVFGRPDQAIA